VLDSAVQYALRAEPCGDAEFFGEHFFSEDADKQAPSHDAHNCDGSRAMVAMLKKRSRRQVKDSQMMLTRSKKANTQANCLIKLNSASIIVINIMIQGENASVQF
jgi:hypothetical protein